MFIKMIKLIRVIFITIIWTLLYAKYGNIVLSKLVGFDFFNRAHWHVLQNQWNGRWVIDSSREYALLFGIFAFIPVWLICLIIWLRTSLIIFIAYPIKVFDKFIYVLSGSREEHRYVLLNMIKSQKLKDSIDQYITPKKSKTELEAEKIRVEVRKKVRLAREAGII